MKLIHALEQATHGFINGDHVTWDCDLDDEEVTFNSAGYELHRADMNQEIMALDSNSPNMVGYKDDEGNTFWVDLYQEFPITLKEVEGGAEGTVQVYLDVKVGDVSQSIRSSLPWVSLTAEQKQDLMLTCVAKVDALFQESSDTEK